MACISRNRSGYMHTNRWTARGVAAALIALGAAACTDPTVAPTSTVTGANFYNDLGSYQAFLAKVYAGLAVGGQNGGDGSTDIQGIDGGFSQYMRLYWELQELPTDEAVIAFGSGGTAGRAAALRKVAESGSLTRAEFNPSFVLMEYFGYLRRDPDEAGYQFWLAKLNQFGGDFVRAEMVKAFLSADEYRARFPAQ